VRSSRSSRAWFRERREVALIGRTGDFPGHLKYVDWFNHRRLLEACEDILFELEQAHYRQ
jgi:hypothetical protein